MADKFDPKKLTYGELEKRVIETDLCLGCAHELVCGMRQAMVLVQRDRPWHVAVGSCGHYQEDK